MGHDPAPRGPAAPPARTPYAPETLAALACDLDARPQDAPHFEALAESVRAVRREAGTLIVDVGPEAEDTLEAIVDAERRCCAAIGWHLARVEDGVGTGGTLVRLRIEADRAQLDAIESLFNAAFGAPFGTATGARSSSSRKA